MKLFVIFLLLSIPCFVYGSVVINEIAWMGTEASYNNEWIELYNSTDDNIRLDGWTLKADDGNPEISLEGTIPAKGFFLLERTDDDSNPNKTANLIYAGSLNNSGENLRLYNNSGKIIDEILNQDGWTGGDNKTKETMKRNNIEVEPPRIEPPAPEVKSMVIYPKNIIFNEILPSPEGPDSENEWIELYNQNNFEVDLNNWIIKDIIGGVKEYILKTTIPGLGYLVLKRPDTKITLNNDNDELNLINPNGGNVDSVSFGKAPQGQSYSRSSSEWFWTTTLTPENQNIITKESTSQPKQVNLIKNKDQESVESVEVGPRRISKLVNSFENPPGVSVFLIALVVALGCSVAFLIIKSNLKGFWY